MRALNAHWSFVIGTLEFLKRATVARSTVDADEVFEFNLQAWVLELGAKAPTPRVATLRFRCDVARLVSMYLDSYDDLFGED